MNLRKKEKNGNELNNGLIGKEVVKNKDNGSVAQIFANLGYEVTGIGSGVDVDNQIKIELGVNSSAILGKSIYALEYRENDGAASSKLGDWAKILWNTNGNEYTVSGKVLEGNILIFPKAGKSNGKWEFIDDGGSNVPSIAAGQSSQSSSGKGYAFALCDNSGVSDFGTDCADFLFVSYFTGADARYGLQALNRSDGNNTSIVSELSPDGTLSKDTAGAFTLSIVSSTAADNDPVYTDYELHWPDGQDPMVMLEGLNNDNNVGYQMNRASSYEDLALTPQEVYDLYTYYITNIYKIQVVCDDEDGFDTANSGSSNPEISWKAGHVCRQITNNKKKPSEKVYGVDNDNHFTVEVDLEDILKKLDSIIDEVDTSGAITISNEDEEDIKKTCRNSEGAEGLGWIVCPLLEWFGGAAGSFYEKSIEPNLNVEPELFSGGNQGIRSAWGTFRDIANVVFIIFLLFVIFSQLTGIGIDNYGIKKILPKLIVAAVLINLSYLLCVLFVDISNILGNGLQSIFASLGGDSLKNIELNGAQEQIVFETGQKASISDSLVGVGALGAIVFAVGAIWANPAILLSLAIATLGVLVSIIFLFVLLAARKAAILVLTILSPLAVVCSMLPNTKKLTDRWIKLFEGLLLVYPIAGLLIGGGDYIARFLLKNSDGFFTWLTAIIISVAPIFLIPTVLRGAFSAMGKLGGMLAGMGTRASGMATGAVRNSEGFKNAQRMGLERKTRLQAGYDEKTGGLNRIGRAKSALAQTRFGRLTGMNKRQAARLAQAKKNDLIGQEATATLVAETSAANIARSGLSREAFFERQFNDAAKNGDVRKMNSAIDAAKQRGVKPKDIAGWIRRAENNGHLNFKDAQSRANWMNSLNTKYGDIMSTDFELFTWAMKGGNEVLGNYGEYAAAGGVSVEDIKPEDVVKLSGGSLAGMIASGVINRSMAQRVMAMNPNISADKRIMLGAAATGVGVTDVNAFKNEAEALASNSGATTWVDGATGTTHAISQITAGSNAVSAWASATPQDVNVVQNFQGGGQQYEAVKGDLVGDSAAMLGNIEASTGHTAAATTQTAINTHQVAENTERGANAAEQTVLNTRQAAINTHQVAENTERGANAAEQTVLNTRQAAINTHQVAENTERGANAAELTVTHTERGANAAEKVVKGIK